MKKFKKAQLLWSIPVIIVLFFISCPIVNTITASSVAKEIWDIPLPPQTEKIERISKAGKLVGNGNGMQFFGAVLLESQLSFDELKKYYSDYSQNEWSCIVDKQNSNEIDEIEHGKLNFDSSVDTSRSFIVYSWGNGVFPFCEFDLRGH